MTKIFVASDLQNATIPLTTLTDKNIMKNGSDIDVVKCNG